MTLEEIKADFRLYSGEEFPTEEELRIINNWIKYLYKELIQFDVFKTNFFSTVGITVDPEWIAQLPDDFIERVRITEENTLDSFNYFQNEDYRIIWNNIVFNNIASTTAYLHYMRERVLLVNDTDIPDIPSRFHNCINDAILYIYFKMDRNMQELANQKQILEIEINKSL